MPPAKPDRRTERTRGALMGAFIGLVLEEGYDAVTVERVAERANVGRSTFYMHFTGKEEILRHAMARPSSVLAVLVGNEVPQEALVKQLLHFQEQRSRNQIFFSAPVRAIWVKVLAELIEKRLPPIVRHARARPVLPLPLTALQIAESQIALITNWLTGRGAAKVEAVAEALAAGTNGLLGALLRCPQGPLTIPGEKLRFIRDDGGHKPPPS